MLKPAQNVYYNGVKCKLANPTISDANKPWHRPIVGKHVLLYYATFKDTETRLLNVRECQPMADIACNDMSGWE